jgi:diacylglycerol kinase (ATP)
MEHKSWQHFSLKARRRSFRHALEGLLKFLLSEHNAWIHLLATMLVLLLSLIFKVSTGEALAVTLTIGLVWVAEIFNTTIEKIMDFISKEKNETIKTIKDISAAAVLVSAVVALITGCIVFIPKITT